MPFRIQLSRAKGWRMPANTLKVDRSTRYGNPFHAGMYRDFTTEDAVGSYRRWVSGDLCMRSAGEPPDLAPLRGKNQACWCRLCPAHAAGKPLGVVCNDCAPCHADVLLELANA